MDATSGNAHFSVNTRLTSLLGEAYRSSEAALKELVDNAWDADANNVWITLPEALSGDPVEVRDDGAGMTAAQMRSDYLNIASDKRMRTGERSPRLNRRIKGRKGIGKFAGLALANRMQVSAVARGQRCTLVIDKSVLAENVDDLEAVPLPFDELDAGGSSSGTAIVLSELDARLNFPTADRLREVLVYEYGREDSFKVFVDGVQLTVEDVPGTSRRKDTDLALSGSVGLHFTISDAKRPPKSSGIILRVDGKAVGKPMLFGLDNDEDIPLKLAKRVYGEIDVTGRDDFVTADWGGVIENSKAYQELRDFVVTEVKQGLKDAHANEMTLQKARLQKQLKKRLEQLPEHRRKYAEEAVMRILGRFYGESPERISTIADVALDAMEHDAHWVVLDNISSMSKGDVGAFAKALDDFGLMELSALAAQVARRLTFLDHLDELVANPATLEKQVHIALESNLWVLGRNYDSMASNKTLRAVIGEYCDEEFSGERASKRPDLLLAQDFRDRMLLVEFKRPSHAIGRDDINQAEKYRDDLQIRIAPSSVMEILMLGRGRVESVHMQNLAPNIRLSSYRAVISSARTEFEWLMKSLSDV
jgi:hypothetical protein